MPDFQMVTLSIESRKETLSLDTRDECYGTAVCVSSSCLCQLVLLSESTEE